MPVTVALVDFRAVPAPDAELAAVAVALTRQAVEHFAEPPPNGWGVSAIVTSGRSTTVQPHEWVLGLFDHPDQPGALGYHEKTRTGQPLMKVFPALCEQDGVSWSSCASHELLETLADPECCRAAQDKHGSFWALEVSDAVEADSYAIDGVAVSNFVTPAYFEPPSGRAGVKFDYLGKVKAPYALRPGGYNQVFVPGSGWVQKTADKLSGYRTAFAGRRSTRRETHQENTVTDPTPIPAPLVTPPWLDKGLWLSVLTPLLAALNQRFGIALDPVAIIGLALPVVGYVVMHKWKTATVLAAQLGAKP